MKGLFSHNKINFNRSVLVKSAIFFILVITIVLVASTYLLNKKATRTVELYSQDRLKHTSNIVERAFYSMLKEVENDISLISKNVSLKHFINAPSTRNLKQFDNLFPIILSEKPNYFQIRLLDINDEGKELIKYEKHKDTVFKTPKDKLQYKGNKNYYKNALSINAPFYFSEINLNEEYGKVSTPLRPTLRAIGKLFDTSGTLKFMIIINIDLSNFYDEILQINRQEIKSIIVDELGEFKYENNFDNCFGFQRNTNITFKKVFNTPIDSLILKEQSKKNLIQDSNGQNHIYHLKEVTYSSGLNKLYLVTVASQKNIFANVTLINKYSLHLVLIICCIIFVIIFSYAYYFAKKIRKVTNAISGYNDESFSDSFLVDIKDRKDEIGLLARTYIRMKNDIDSNIAKLKTSLKQEKAAIQEKDEFLQNMGHEIRTPLNNILGLTNLLTRNKPLEAQKPIIKALERSARNLNGLMHDILDEQKLIQGKITLTPTEANIHKLLENIVSNYMFEAVKKGLDINLNTSEDIRKKQYLIDILRFEQIVTNLLVNAIKYTSKGNIDIKALIDNDELSLEVADTGEGISNEHINKIKTRFYRVNDLRSDKEEGFGLGLSIVVKLISLFNGNLEVSSSKKGSIFRFSIPIKISTSRNAISSENDVLYPSLFQGCKILHIEDDVSSLFMIKTTFEAIGIELEQVSTIFDAENILKNTSFDLILTDLMLGSENIIDYVKNELYQYNIPIVVLSALANFDTDNLDIRCLQKPMELNTLTDYIVTLTCKNEFDTPKLDNIYKQYDNDTNKTKKYLTILIQEINQYHSRILAVLETKNQEEWDAIKHKIVTHIDSLKLDQMKAIFQEDINSISLEKSKALIDNIRYLLCYLRNEQRTNLAN